MMEFSFDGSGNYYCAVRLLHNVTLLGTCPSLNGSVINSRINQWATTVFINIGYPLLLVMATLGNGGYLVFLSFQKRSTRTLYLAVTALSGIILIWLELPRFLVTSSDSLRRHRDFIVYVLHSMGLQLFAEDLFSQISNWTIIALSMERVLVISKPLQYRHGVPLRYGYLVVMGIGVLALAVAIPGIVVFYWSLNAIGIFAANECTNHAMAITLHDVRNLAKILVIVEGLYVAIVVPLGDVGDHVRHQPRSRHPDPAQQRLPEAPPAVGRQQRK
ncbi:uncharacterized protein LOC129582352 [Paramacrobiotus metropolitanus]|uniref:uncharacterized protein LOC129582352 n=1 Tax=Paramacrobiotus metropolitanus TaxID=2943436 RepID=UPI002445AA92|nr:uncharacterized protein LOC129582352 [Paramacrobiotus metropolitanus]